MAEETFGGERMCVGHEHQRPGRDVRGIARYFPAAVDLPAIEANRRHWARASGPKADSRATLYLALVANDTLGADA